MGFTLTLVYIAVTLLTPDFMPAAIVQLHVQALICALAVLGTLISTQRSRFPRTPEAYLLLGLLLAVGASRMANGWVRGGIDAIVAFLPSAIVFYLVIANFRSLKRLRVLMVMMVAIGLYVIARSTVAYAASELSSQYLEIEQVAENIILRFRGLGVLGDPNDTAQYLLTIIPLLWIGSQKRNAIGRQAIAMILTGLLLFGIVMTHSRGAAFALLVLILFVFRDRFGVFGSSLIAALALGVLIVFGIAGGRGMTQDDGGRMEAWSTGLTILKSAPLFGVGYGQFGNYSDTGLTAHNSFILCLAELGLFGYFFWIGLLVSTLTGVNSVIKHTGRNRKDDEAVQGPLAESVNDAGDGPVTESRPSRESMKPILERRAYAIAIRTSIVGFMGAGFFLSKTYAMVLYLLLGMAVCIRYIPADEPSPFTLRYSVARTLAIIAGSVTVMYVMVRLSWAF